MSDNKNTKTSTENHQYEQTEHAGFSDRETVIQLLMHARSKDRCILEFKRTDDNETIVMEITDHVIELENTDASS